MTANPRPRRRDEIRANHSTGGSAVMAQMAQNGTMMNQLTAPLERPL